jgi:hypothetical protein
VSPAPITHYPFRGANEEIGYRLFPPEIEDDELIFFHGTAYGNLQSIIDNGFRIGGPLPSISFARDSSVPLGYACKARKKESPEGCVLAVRFDNPNRQGIRHEPFGIHVDVFSDQPTIVGYCIIPADYVFL